MHGSGARPIIPALARLHETLAPFAWPLVRATIGLTLVPHGAQKLFGWFGGGGIAGTAQGFEGMGFQPGVFWAVVAGLVEFVGGLMLAAGFLTRLVAAIVFVFLMVTVIAVHWPAGFFWTNGGFEYPLLWALVALAFVFAGGGRWSVDAALGREL